MITGLLLSIFLQAGAPAAAEPEQSAPPARTATASEAPIDVTAQNRVRCRTQQVTGRKIPVRRCTTQREEAEQREEARRFMERLNETAQTSQPMSNDVQ